MHKLKFYAGIGITVIGVASLFLSAYFALSLSHLRERLLLCDGCSAGIEFGKALMMFAFTAGIVLTLLGITLSVFGLKDISMMSFSRNTKT